MFTGREKELKILEEGFRSSQSELCVIYGRRRIGKSTLLEHFVKGRPCFFYTAGKEPKRLQLKRFVRELGETTGDSLTSKVTVSEWEDALTILDRNLSVLRHGHKKVGKALVIFDEFQWMCSGGIELISDLQRFWDKHWKRNNRIDLILCGSSISFMLGEVLSQKSPLFGRRTRSFKLEPFSLKLASKFLPGRGRYEIAEAYLAVGGVPMYLEVLRGGKSVRQALGAECFRSDGYFFDEVRFVLSEQLKETNHYFMLLSRLAQNPCQVAEMEEATGIPTGQIMFYLERLQMLGFVSRHTPFGARILSKTVRYRLDDYYLRFYFAFIHPRREQIVRYSSSLSFDQGAGRQWEAFTGRVFEAMARDHVDLIAHHLGHGSVLRSGSFWRKPTQRRKGVQIDLLIECEDKTLLLCECKWGRTPIGMEVVTSLRQKAGLFPNPQHATIRLVLVMAGRATPMVQKQRDITTIGLNDFWR